MQDEINFCSLNSVKVEWIAYILIAVQTSTQPTISRWNSSQEQTPIYSHPRPSHPKFFLVIEHENNRISTVPK